LASLDPDENILAARFPANGVREFLVANAGLDPQRFPDVNHGARTSGVALLFARYGLGTV